jgi:SAM-dependent methyltransferase
MSTANFYDQMAPFYHLIFPHGFDHSIEYHARALAAIIRQEWGEGVRSILDVSCGIGTQALGLAGLGYQVTASDLSPQAVERAKNEAQMRGLNIDFSVADMRRAYEHHGRQFDLVLAADNAVPHLLSDGEILAAFRQFFNCCRSGGGCMISVRDYEREDLTSGQVRPYGLRVEGGVRYLIFQVWEFTGPIYEISMYFVRDDRSVPPQTQVMRTHYYAVGIPKLIDLLRQAGFARVRRIDEGYFQPVLIATRQQV